MNLQFDLRLAEGYKSPSQRARRLTEGWFAENMYCAACPNDRLERTRGSTEVVDFLCPKCRAEYQVKAKAGALGARLRDAAYGPMIRRAKANRNVEPKIRQQLQVLRDHGIVRFLGRGRYVVAE